MNTPNTQTLRQFVRTRLRSYASGGIEKLLFLLVFFLSIQITAYADHCHSCVSEVNFGLSGNCIDTVEVQDLLADSSNCSGVLSVVLYLDGDSIGNVVDASMIGMTLDYIIFDDIAQQDCSGRITILDGAAPTLICPMDTAVFCLNGLDVLPPPDVTDCSDFSISSRDSIIASNNCDSDTIEHRLRRYIATDVSGNSDTCFQNIYRLRADVEDVEFPSDLIDSVALSCSGAENTDPEFTGFPTLDSIELRTTSCRFSITHTDIRAETCGNAYKISRRWVVTDLCTHEADTGIQLIDIVDDIAPVITLMDTLRMEADEHDCGAEINLPASDVSDNCSSEFSFQITGPFNPLFTNGGIIEVVEEGTYDVIYRVTDGCGNVARDTLVLVVEDTDPPVPVCKLDIVVPLTADGTAWIPSEVLDAGSYDNCTDVYFKGRRMDPNTQCDPNNPENLFDDKLYFCCDDASEDFVQVILRVYSVDPGEGAVSEDTLDGYFSECMVRVRVDDKLPPQVICPSDLTVSCELTYNPDDLSIFGAIVQDVADRDSICLDDPGNPSGACQGIDGYVQDNCNLSISETSEIEIDMCRTGEIRRIFTITDDAGNESQCTQTITIINYEPFYINASDSQDPDDDVIWPKDFFTSDMCGLENIDPENLPDSSAFPIILDDDCDQIGFNHSDEVFDFSLQGEACAKIVRTWRVMDWCQFEAGEFKSWTYQQTIVLYNSVAPTIDSDLNDLSVCTDDAACGPGFIELIADASDDCTPRALLRTGYIIDLYSDNVFDAEESGLDASGTYPIGTHTVIWEVEDRCGNEVRESQIFEIINCKKPTPVCHNNLTTVLMPIDEDNDGIPDVGMLEVSADELDKGSYHLCGYEVTASFSSDSSDQTRMFDCNDVGENTVQLWITDENGHQEFCETTLTIQNNEIPNCDGFQDGDMGIVSGLIQTVDNEQMPHVSVELIGSGMNAIESDENGYFEFPAMPAGGEYTVVPAYEMNIREGISTLDIVKIQKHLLGTEAFDTPEKFIAADVNKSGSVSALDMTELRKLILGDIDEFSNNKEWCFMYTDHNFIEPKDALKYEFPQLYQIDALTETMEEIEFIGVKIGDVNNSSSMNGLATTENRNAPVSFSIKDQKLPGGYAVNLPIYIEDKISAQGMQFALAYDTEKIEVLAIESSLASFDESHYRIDQESGQVIVSWNGMEAQEMSSEALFDLRIKTLGDVKLSESIQMSKDLISAELYNAHSEVYEVDLRYQELGSKNIIDSKFVPNPFSDATNLNYYLAKDLRVRIDIFNGSGQRVFNAQLMGHEGANVLTIPGDYFESDGVYHCKISSRQEILTSKLIYISKRR